MFCCGLSAWVPKDDAVGMNRLLDAHLDAGEVSDGSARAIQCILKCSRVNRLSSFAHND